MLSCITLIVIMLIGIILRVVLQHIIMLSVISQTSIMPSAIMLNAGALSKRHQGMYLKTFLLGNKLGRLQNEIL